jgi:ADP-heptose:LPS heptosyltransferase
LAIDSGVPIRIGFGLRGRSWEYHALIPYDPQSSLGQNWLHSLGVLGLDHAEYRGPVLPAAPQLDADAPIVIQPGSRSRVKEAPLDFWQALLPRLAERAPLLLVGNADDRARFAALRDSVPADRLHDHMGQTTVPELIACTGRARAMIGVESMVAHIAVGHGRPTVVLNNPNASGIIAFPDGLPSLTFVDMTLPAPRAADACMAHLDRWLS